MARRSVESRCDRILNRLLPIGSFERRVHDLPADLRGALELHQTKTDAIVSGIEKRDGAGGAFARLAEGDLVLPAMPEDLRTALGLVDPPTLTEDMTVAEIADVYRDLIGDDQS